MKIEIKDVRGIIIIVPIVLYTGIHLLNVNLFNDFLSNTLATLVGVGAGIPIALWINRKSQSEEVSRKRNEILRLLKGELLVNRKEVLEGLETIRDNNVPVANVTSEFWKLAIEGGELGGMIRDVEENLLIAQTYQVIETIIDLSKLILVEGVYHDMDIPSGGMKIINEGYEKCRELLEIVLGFQIFTGIEVVLFEGMEGNE